MLEDVTGVKRYYIPKTMKYKHVVDTVVGRIEHETKDPALDDMDWAFIGMGIGKRKGFK